MVWISSEAVVAFIGIILAAIEVWRRTRPRLGVRWHHTDHELGIAVYNDGGRTATVNVCLVGLDQLRADSGKRGQIVIKRDSFPITIRPGEEQTKMITSPYIANWIDAQEDVGILTVALSYINPGWGWPKPKLFEMDWGDHYNTMFPRQSIQEVLVDQMPKLVQAIKHLGGEPSKGLPALTKEVKQLKELMCREPEHQFEDKGRASNLRECERCWKLKILEEGG